MLNNLRLFFLLCLTTNFLGNSVLNTACFHACILIDSLCDIRESTTQDAANIQKEIEKACQYTEMKLQLTVLKDNEASFERLHQWIMNLNPLPEDIILFYFSGHGFRTNQVMTVWPILLLSSQQRALDFYHLYTLLQKQPAHLCILLCDCCNKFVNMGLQRHKPQIQTKKEKKSRLRESYRKLFLETNGIIIASSSEIGQPSWGTNTGGIFTQAIVSALELEAKEKMPSWPNIFRKVYQWCSLYQKPQAKWNIFDGSKPQDSVPLIPEDHLAPFENRAR